MDNLKKKEDESQLVPILDPKQDQNLTFVDG